MTCRGCRSDRLDPVFEMEPMPLAGAFAATAEDARAMPRYPLTWMLCADCGLVNVEPDIPDELIYSTYSYAASTVPALVRHHADFGRILRERYGLEPLRFLEIGGNDGVLLNQTWRGWDRWNVDPSDVAESASVNAAWQWARSLDEVDGQFDVITSSNAFAHFTGIADALDRVAELLKPGSEFWIEVHDLDATLESRQWDTIYHEHKVEWSVDSLAMVGARHGLSLVQWSRLPLHGGLIRARFVHGRPIWGRQDKDFGPLRDAYANRQSPDLPPGSWAYGAAARATVYLNQVQPGIVAVVDGSPLRQGRFIPGTGTPILAPSQFGTPPATLITAWNHAADIKAAHPEYDRWVTAW